MAKGEHVPSKYRALIKESKSGKGRPVEILIKESRDIPDPYYASLALLNISLGRNVSIDVSKKLMAEALTLAGREKRDWRSAELLIAICKKLSSNDRHDEWLRKMILDDIDQISKGKGLAEAISGCANYIGIEHAPELLSMALNNPGFEMEAARAIIRSWAKASPHPQNQPCILKIMENMESTVNKTKLLGYLHSQMASKGNQELTTLTMAIDSAMSLDGEDRIESLRYLADRSRSLEELELIAAGVTEMADPIEESRLFATLAGKADKVGHPDLALDWFTTALDILADVDEPGASAGTLLNIAKGLQRLGEADKAMEIFQLALKDAGDDENLKTRIIRTMEKTAADGGGEVGDGDGDGDGTRPANAGNVTPQKTSSRHILGLYDTYEGGLKPVHIRMIARAAPLCMAYDLDLALFGFPTRDLDRLVARVLGDTNIGKGGRYLKNLKNHGRISLIHCSQQVPPTRQDWLKLGLPVATTSRPSDSKARTLDHALKASRKDHPRGRLCLIMGLGRKGLPKSLLDSVEHHVELTGSNISLETSTAMGIIARELGGL